MDKRITPPPDVETWKDLGVSKNEYEKLRRTLKEYRDIFDEVNKLNHKYGINAQLEPLTPSSVKGLVSRGHTVSEITSEYREAIKTYKSSPNLTREIDEDLEYMIDYLKTHFNIDISIYDLSKLSLADGINRFREEIDRLFNRAYGYEELALQCLDNGDEQGYKVYHQVATEAANDLLRKIIAMQGDNV